MSRRTDELRQSQDSNADTHSGAKFSTLPPAARDSGRYCFSPAERQSTSTPTGCLLLSSTTTLGSSVHTLALRREQQ